MAASWLFYTFRSNTTIIPAEITTQILTYVVRTLSCHRITMHSTQHLIASASRILFDQPTSATGRATALVKLKIGEALKFSDLKYGRPPTEIGPRRSPSGVKDEVGIQGLFFHRATE